MSKCIICGDEIPEGSLVCPFCQEPEDRAALLAGLKERCFEILERYKTGKPMSVGEKDLIKDILDLSRGFIYSSKRFIDNLFSVIYKLLILDKNQKE